MSTTIITMDIGTLADRIAAEALLRLANRTSLGKPTDSNIIRETVIDALDALATTEEPAGPSVTDGYENRYTDAERSEFKAVKSAIFREPVLVLTTGNDKVAVIDWEFARQLLPGLTDLVLGGIDR